MVFYRRDFVGFFYLITTLIAFYLLLTDDLRVISGLSVKLMEKKYSRRILFFSAISSFKF